MQIVSQQITTKSSNGHVRRQRISSQRGEVNLIAGWSRSSQHATIRYIVNYIHCYPITISCSPEHNVSLIIHCRPGNYAGKGNALTTIVA
jgi:hypothetical protein